TVSLYGQLLQRHGVDASANSLLETIIGATEHMEQLIQGVLEYSRASREPFEPSDHVDLNKVLAVVQENLSVQIAENGAEITHSHLPELFGSRLQLIRLLQNLIQNSLKYRSAERACRINVYAERYPEHWVISVQDNGVGFKAEYEEYVFGMFKRLERARAGAGLGLAICRAIVERYGGTIRAEAEEGAGAIFHFTWPIEFVARAEGSVACQVVQVMRQ